MTDRQSACGASAWPAGSRHGADMLDQPLRARRGTRADVADPSHLAIRRWAALAMPFASGGFVSIAPMRLSLLSRVTMTSSRCLLITQLMPVVCRRPSWKCPTVRVHWWPRKRSTIVDDHLTKGHLPSNAPALW